jgi:hypothetical protein
MKILKTFDRAFRQAGAQTILVLTLVLALAIVLFPPLVLPIVAVLLAIAWAHTPHFRLCTIAGAGSTQDRYQDKPCTVVVKNNFDTHGTITRASVEYLAPQDVFDLFKPGGLYADMNAWFRTSFEMKACGTKVNGLYDWLMSSQKSMGHLLNEEKVQMGPSLLFPFVLGRQDSVINTEYWAITSGQAKSGYTAGVTGPLTSGDLALGASTDRVVRIVSRYGVDLDAKWFQPPAVIYIFTREANGAGYQGQWKVLASEQENAAAPGYVDVLITSQNGGNAAPYNQTPTSGVVLIGPNNVTDFESYCLNRPTLDPRRNVPFWYQTMRRARTVDSEYKLVFAKLIETNEYFRQFGDLPLSIRNAQDERNFQKEWLNAFFFGQPISQYQTLANWKSLEAIYSVTGANVDPGQGGKLMARRANMIGVKEQLLRCGQLKDIQNNPLNFYEWLNDIYTIYRARDSQGKPSDSQDWYTNAPYAAQLESAFVGYYKQEYSDMVRMLVETGGNELGFKWRTFEVKFPAGIKINLVTHNYFDDFRNAFSAESITSAGNLLLCLEMGKGGTIYPGMIKSNKVMRTLGQLNQLAAIDRTFACTMESPTEDISLTSETCTAVVECPANNEWIQGPSDAVPILTGVSGNTAAAYGNLY